MKIEGFRSFLDFSVANLARVNLFVGRNNAGKTSLLEAVEILATNSPEGLIRGPRRRNEDIYGSSREFLQDHFAHLFHGHSVEVGKKFRISGQPKSFVECEIVPDADATQLELIEDEPLSLELDSGSMPFQDLDITFRSNSYSEPISLRGGFRRAMRFEGVNEPVNFIGTDEILGRHLAYQWDKIVLTSEEKHVTQALKIIDPRIERIAFLAEGRKSAPAIFLRLKGSQQRLPLGSVGDGLKRLLSLAIHLSSSAGGWLLIDEIDTGLHYSALEGLWRLIVRTAKRLNVQVCATTHSLDCVNALAAVIEAEKLDNQLVSLQRVEAERDKAIEYTAEEIVVAASQNLELR